MQQLVIIGAGGFGREVLDVIEAINLDHATTGVQPFEVLGFLDDGEPDLATLAPYGVRHLGPVAQLDSMDPDVGYVIGIGSPRVRRKIDEQYAVRFCPVLIHPSVTYSRAVEFGPGCVVCAGVRLTNNIHLGRHVHANLNTTIGHDARLGDYVTLRQGHFFIRTPRFLSNAASSSWLVRVRPIWSTNTCSQTGPIAVGVHCSPRSISSTVTSRSDLTTVTSDSNRADSWFPNTSVTSICFRPTSESS